MQKVAAKIVDKYQKTPCADLIAKKQQPPSEELKKVMAILKSNPDLRTNLSTWSPLRSPTRCSIAA